MSIDRNMKTGLLNGALHSSYNQFGKCIFKIFSLIIIHTRGRTPSITPLHTKTRSYFDKRLVQHFNCSPKVVVEEITTDISNLLQEFWTSCNLNGAVETSFFPLLGILQNFFDNFWKDKPVVCFDIIIFFATAVDLELITLQISKDPSSHDAIFENKFTILYEGYRKAFDQSLSNSKDLGDMLRLLPGVVVQNDLSMQGMADLYRISPGFLERLKSIGLLRLSPLDLSPSYTLDDYLSGFLRDRDRSQLYYCDPELQHIQHISICRQILSLLSYQSNQS